MSGKPVLFCDFDGVLCHDRFWRSQPSHVFEAIQSFLFEENRDTVMKWMLGKLTSEDIHFIIAKQLHLSYVNLFESFIAECRSMSVNLFALASLTRLREKYITILITVNTDSFNKYTVPALGLARYFDRIVNSYDESMFKEDQQGALFRKYLSLYRAGVSSCLLYDDSPKVIAAFLALGGQAHLVTASKSIDHYSEDLGANT